MPRTSERANIQTLGLNSKDPLVACELARLSLSLLICEMGHREPPRGEEGS